MERIVAVAHRVPTPQHLRNEVYLGKRVYPDYIYVTCPATQPDYHAGRHHTVMHVLHARGIDVKDVTSQGFITSEGRWVDRYEGCKIARAANQIKQKTGPDDMLFSEDMW